MAQQTKRPRVAGNSNKTLKLEPNEQLLIWRRRLDWDQTRAAKYFKCSLFNYKLAEYGKLEKFKYPKEDKSIYPLADFEKCFIYRKRANKTQREIANSLKISREWFRLQEQGKVSCTKLLSYWETEQKTK